MESPIARLQELMQKAGHPIPRYTWQFQGHDPQTNYTRYVATVHTGVPQHDTFESESPQRDKQLSKESAARHALHALETLLLQQIDERRQKAPAASSSADSKKGAKKRKHGDTKQKWDNKRKNGTGDSKKKRTDSAKKSKQKKDGVVGAHVDNSCSAQESYTPYRFSSASGAPTYIVLFDLDNLPSLVFCRWLDTCYKVGFLSMFSSSIAAQPKIAAQCELHVVQSATEHAADVQLIFHASQLVSYYKQCQQYYASQQQPYALPHFVLVSRDKFVAPLQRILAAQEVPCTIVACEDDARQHKFIA